jgi:transglutaminase-like putative cysteine protease
VAAALFIRNAIRYVGEYPETFVDLDALLRLGAGDCDDVTRAITTLLLRMGYRPEEIRWAVGHDPQPAHIWVQVRTPDGGWLDLDASTWLVEPGTSPTVVRSFERVTYHPCNELLS